jgi:hypothetical protein
MVLGAESEYSRTFREREEKREENREKGRE